MPNAERKNFSLGIAGNCAIKASAGSGKTFQLAMRFIALLALDPELEPEQIVAITFTRKAAAEIFRKIIDQLLEMAQDPRKLQEHVNHGLLPPQLHPEMIAGILGRVLRSRTLQIGTIDGFLVRILQAFPAEFGLSGAVAMIDADLDPGVRKTVMQLLRQEQEALLPLLRQYNTGRDSKGVHAALEKILQDADGDYGKYLLYPDAELWGNLPEEKIEKTPPLTPEEREKIFTVLAIGMEHYAYPGAVVKHFRELMDAVLHHDAGQVKPFFEVQEKDGDLTFPYNRKSYPISREMYCGVQRLYGALAAEAIRKKREKARAERQLLQHYDELYAANVRNRGKITFRDLPFLLGRLDPEKKLDLEYRLDTRNRHYMLDEFQDTSDRQWQFLENLMDEAIQGQDQSFFMVGDVKQSLYQWRQGNPKLFDAICRARHAKMVDSEPAPAENWSQDEPQMALRKSNRSYRSAPAVLEAVNRVFGHPELQVHPQVKNAIVRMAFQEHVTARDDLSGYAALLVTGEAEETESPGEKAVAKLLTAIDPLRRGLSCAIIVPTNGEVENYKQALRRLTPGLPVSTEGKMKAPESMAYTLLHLLLLLAEHPGDPAALNALPLFAFRNAAPYAAAELAEQLGIPGIQEWRGLASALRKLIRETGIRGIIRRFRAAFDSRMTAFDRERIGVADRAAQDFHGTVDEFLAAAERFSGNVESAEKTIQIMTIHKSKGLEFDVVILPELGYRSGRNGDALTIAPVRAADGDFTPSWVGYLPKKDFDAYLPGIAAQRVMLEENGFYEKCCGLYVAMTRARRGLYMLIGKPPERPGTSYRSDQVLWNALTAGADLPEEGEPVFETGSRQWYAGTGNAGKVGAEETAATAAVTVCRPAAFHWSSPSALHAEAAAEAGQPLFYGEKFASAFAARLGTRIHAMMEAVEFWDNVDDDRIRTICGHDEVSAGAWELWTRATAAEGSIRQALMRPAAPCRVWRERNFLMKLDDETGISGCFDRVLLFLDAQGGIERAEIADYKSDDLKTAEEFLERHSLQLNAYRKALARMLELPEERIGCRIFALRLGKVIPVPGA